jgi:hypothetical protein
MAILDKSMTLSEKQSKAKKPMVTPITLANQEAEIRRTAIRSQS